MAESAPRGRSLAVLWVILALIIIAALAILYAARVRSGVGTIRAEQHQKLLVASAYVAAQGIKDLDAAASNIAAGNYGLAQKDLGSLSDKVALLERIAPSDLIGKVRQVRSSLSTAQRLVGANDRSALEQIDEMKLPLSALAGE
jgi:hypothetical protein